MTKPKNRKMWLYAPERDFESYVDETLLSYEDSREDVLDVLDEPTIEDTMK